MKINNIEMKISEWLLQEVPIISNMVLPHHVKFILDLLEKTIVNNIKGEVVELGCNCGTTSIFIRKMLDIHESSKEFYVYDSFEGLPEKGAEDDLDQSRFQAGEARCSEADFMRSFKRFNLRLPKINKGWFAKIDDEDYPEKISFAFFDGDFYQSIMDSFNKVYHKLSRGATICVHDYGWEILPGVKKACIDFLRDKPEAMCQEVEGVGFLIKE